MSIESVWSRAALVLYELPGSEYQPIINREDDSVVIEFGRNSQSLTLYVFADRTEYLWAISADMTTMVEGDWAEDKGAHMEWLSQLDDR